MDISPRKLTNDLIGVAGVHFVAMELTLRGLIALPTIRNTAGIDLLVSDPTAGRQAALQVKTSMQSVTFWPTSHPERCLRGADSYYVFVRRLPAEDRFEAFIEGSDVVVEQIERNLEDYRARGRKEFPYWGLPRAEGEIERLRTLWRTWRP